MKKAMILAGICVMCLLFVSPVWAGDLGKTVKDAADALGLGGDPKKAEAADTDEKAEKEESADKTAAGDEDITIKGLKEALSVGIQEAVKLVGAEDGFYKNEAIKIVMPEKLKKADEFIRKLGGEELSETLVMKMNRAAEKAAPQAVDIFSDAIKSMKIEDAKGVLTGEGNAATQYLEDNTSGSLKTSFYPIVKGTMEELGAVKLYNDYIGKLASNPLLQSVNVDISQYVTDESIDGLFKMVAEQEQKIRENPAARVTDLLQEVFGGL